MPEVSPRGVIDPFLHDEQDRALDAHRISTQLLRQVLDWRLTTMSPEQRQTRLTALIDQFRDVLADSSEAGNSKEIAEALRAACERFFTLGATSSFSHLAEVFVTFFGETVPFMNERERDEVRRFVVDLMDEESHDPFDRGIRDVFLMTAVQFIEVLDRADRDWLVDEPTAADDHDRIARDYKSSVETALFNADVRKLRRVYSAYLHDVPAVSAGTMYPSTKHTIAAVFARYSQDAVTNAMLLAKSLSPWRIPNALFVQREVRRLSDADHPINERVLAEENVLNFFDAVLCDEQHLPDHPTFAFLDPAQFVEIVTSLSVLLRHRLPLAFEAHARREEVHRSPFASSLPFVERIRPILERYIGALTDLAPAGTASRYRRLLLATLAEAFGESPSIWSRDGFLRELGRNALLPLRDAVAEYRGGFPFLQEAEVRECIVRALIFEVKRRNFGIIAQVAPVLLGERWLVDADVRPLRDAAWDYFQSAPRSDKGQLVVLQRQARVFGFSLPQ